VSLELISRLVFREVPSDFDFLLISFLSPSFDFRSQGFHFRDPPVQALLGESRQFDLRHIEPAGLLGRVDHLEALG